MEMANPEFKADFAEAEKVLKDFSEKINGSFGPSPGGLTSAVSKEMLNVPKMQGAERTERPFKEKTKKIYITFDRHTTLELCFKSYEYRLGKSLKEFVSIDNLLNAHLRTNPPTHKAPDGGQDALSTSPDP